MTDYSELKRLAERIREGSGLQGMNAEEAMFNFECAATPNVILALIAENEALRKDAERFRFIKNKQTFIWLIADWFPTHKSAWIDVDAAIDDAMSRGEQE